MAKLIINSEPFLTELPPLRVLTRTPVLIERDGCLVEVVGYDQPSGVYADGRAVEQVSLDEAKVLFGVLLDDFNFATPADRSRAAAAVITPAMVFGGLLGGRPPMDLGEANDSQAGKGYRNRVTAAVYNDVPKCVVRRSGGVGSIEESFDRVLIQGSSFISLDNIRGKIDSQSIESFLTEPSYSARIPYSRPMEIDPARVVVMMTSNKAELTADLGNRCSCVEILKQNPEYEFRVFSEGDLLLHVMANRERFLGAIFSLIREWHSRGKPVTNETRHDFRAWARKLDWIVQNLLGETPLLDGHEQSKKRMTDPALNWLRDVALAVERVGRLGVWLKTNDLVEIVDSEGTIEVPGTKGEHDDLTDDCARTRVLQATGRRLAKCFRKTTSPSDQEPSQTSYINIATFMVERHEELDEEARPRRIYRFTANSPLYETAVSPIPPMGSSFSDEESNGCVEQDHKVNRPIGGIGGNEFYRGSPQNTQTNTRDSDSDAKRGWI